MDFQQLGGVMSIKKHIFSAISVFVIILMPCYGSNTITPAIRSYIQLASNDTQLTTANTINMPIKATLSVQDGKDGDAIKWHKDTNTLTVNENGTYFLMTTAQIGAKEDVPVAGADIRLWYTINGKEIINSGNWVYAAKTARSKTIVSQIRINLKKDDQIGIMYSASAINAGLLSLPNNPIKNLPNAPSLTITMFKSLANNQIQIVSTDTQLVTKKTINAPIPITFNTQDSKEGTAIDWNKNIPATLTIKKSGSYGIVTTAQVGTKEGAPLDQADIRLWYTLNGKEIAGSSNWVQITDKARSNTIVSPICMNFKAGDKINLMYAANKANVGLLALPANKTKHLPSAPSLTVTMTEVPAGSIQLVSDNTQMVTKKMLNTPIKATLSAQNSKPSSAISWNKNTPEVIKVDADGKYLLITVAQIGIKPGVPFAGADIRFWYTLNGKEIIDTGNWIYAADTARSNTIVSQVFMDFKKGDQINLMYSASAADVGLFALPADMTKNLPNAPSLTVTMINTTRSGDRGYQKIINK